MNSLLEYTHGAACWAVRVAERYGLPSIALVALRCACWLACLREKWAS